MATRYFEASEDGELKARGLAFRRDDTPPLIKEVEMKMLGLLTTWATSREYHEKTMDVGEVLQDYLARLETDDLKKEAVLVVKSSPQKVNEYKGDNLPALALRQLDDAGIEIHPGEKVHYLIRDSVAKNREERVWAYPFSGPTISTTKKNAANPC